MQYSLNGESSMNATAPGVRLDVIRSANESSSLPIGDCTFKALAVAPSQKSNNTPIITNSIVMLQFPSNAIKVAIMPQAILDNVIIFGICFFITSSPKR